MGRGRALAISSVALAAACGGARGEWEERFDAIRAEADARAAAVALPSVDAADALWTVPAGVPRLLVTRDEIAFDASPLAARSFPEGATEAERVAALPAAPQRLTVVPGLPASAGSLSPPPPPARGLEEVAVLAEAEADAALVLAALDRIEEGLGTRRAALVVRAPRGLEAIALSLRDLAAEAEAARRAEGPSIRLEAVVRSDGIALRAEGGGVEAGCQTVRGGEPLTLPDRGGRPDAEAAAACVARIREALPEERTVFLAASSGVTAERLAAAAAALAGPAREGRWDAIVPVPGRLFRPETERVAEPPAVTEQERAVAEAVAQSDAMLLQMIEAEAGGSAAPDPAATARPTAGPGRE